MNKYGYNNIEFHNESVKKWWRPKIDKEILKELHKKRELPAILNTFIYFSFLGEHGTQFQLFYFMELFILLLTLGGMNMDIKLFLNQSF